MALNTYSTGTVSVSANGTTVTGAGTIWSGNKAVAGDEFVIDGVRALIVDVVSVTELTITPWPGSDESGASYAIYQTSSQRFADVQIAIDAGKIVDALNTEGFYIFVSSAATAPDPSLGDDGQYAFQATTGKLWIKESGVWTFLGVYKGFNFRGAYDVGATYSVNDVFTSGGSAYIVTAAPPVGTTPPNATYYDVLAAGGTDGADGAAATIAVGTTTTGAAGTDASVTNSGTSSAAVLDFAIPAGQPPLKPIEAWATGTAYVAGPPASFVSQGGSAYECLVDHTSGTFATDLAAGKWGIVASKGTDGTGTGDVQGPAASTDGALVVFDGADGKHVKVLVDADAALTNLGGSSDGINIFKGGITSPTTQVFKSGSGTYITPVGVKWIKVRMVGAGAGGSGGDPTHSGGLGTNGGDTTFGSFTAGGGQRSPSAGTAGPGGTVTGTPSIIGISGGGGQGTWNPSGRFVPGGNGGLTPFGGGGTGGALGGGSGASGVANTGGGGGGGSTAATGVDGGGGGGGGAYIETLITSPAASYSYSIGAGGSAGAAGTNGFAAGAGGSGLVIVEEYYG